jgi:hypothetical protein
MFSKGRQAPGLISQIGHRRVMSKERKEQTKRWQPATDALETAKHFRRLQWDKESSQSSSFAVIYLTSSSHSPSASTSTIYMSSLFQEANSIHEEVFQFPAIAWAFDQDDEDVTGFSQPSFKNSTNPDCSREDTDDTDMPTILSPKLNLKIVRRIDSESPAGMVRSRALYSNLFQLGAAAGSFSTILPSSSR